MESREEGDEYPLSPGDLLFLFSGQKWYERLICRATRGPFTRVEIVIDSSRTLGAHPWGVSYSAIGTPGTFVRVPMEEYVDLVDIQAGLLWAIQYLGKQYSVWDRLAQHAKFFLPWTVLPLVRDTHPDSASFVIHYLRVLSILGAAQLDAYTTSVNDLARSFNLYKATRPLIWEEEEEQDA